MVHPVPHCNSTETVSLQLFFGVTLRSSHDLCFTSAQHAHEKKFGLGESQSGDSRSSNRNVGDGTGIHRVINTDDAE